MGTDSLAKISKMLQNLSAQAQKFNEKKASLGVHSSSEEQKKLLVDNVEQPLGKLCTA